MALICDPCSWANNHSQSLSSCQCTCKIILYHKLFWIPLFVWVVIRIILWYTQIFALKRLRSDKGINYKSWFTVSFQCNISSLTSILTISSPLNPAENPALVKTIQFCHSLLICEVSPSSILYPKYSTHNVRLVSKPKNSAAAYLPYSDEHYTWIMSTFVYVLDNWLICLTNIT